ncbi:MFS transporter [Glutamicibacter ardleyensis]|uniref:MFS transporter n=1 Tax=Glutamicibacter ardleyensis TaxID=225894 RepID=A0ABQ2DBM5_9MICC|nr:MFS transporter [Glutamicibacter ardleyensis]GGJ50349.1 MFS transporter [Glutamicibacter ardleyensis]
MNSTNNSVDTHQRTDSAWIITVFAGVMAALHIWKLPSAIPVLQEQLHLSLIFSGVLLGVVQVAGMLGGLSMSLLAEIYSQRKIMILGLLLLVLGSALGSFSPNAAMLLGTRVIEGAGVIMCSVMGPGLVRAHAPLKRMNLAVGWWAAFMGIATFFGVLGTAIALRFISWQIWWLVLAALTVIPIILILKFVSGSASGGGANARVALRRIAVTAASGKIWVSGVIFGCYTVQWMAIVGFLPTVFREDGLSPILGGLFSAVVGGLNALGAIITGLLLQRGIAGKRLLLGSFVIMAVTAVLTFAIDYPKTLVLVQVLCVGLFSLCGAAVPATMTRLAVDLAPEGGSAPAAMGLMQQIFNIGNFTGPMLVAWLVVLTGGWSSTWWVSVFFGTLGLAMVLVLLPRNSPLNSIQHA